MAQRAPNFFLNGPRTTKSKQASRNTLPTHIECHVLFGWSQSNTFIELNLTKFDYTYPIVVNYALTVLWEGVIFDVN